ncbi:2OG-Fe(II) oxygenase [Pleionea mediterranea]|uniref:SM-20-related protein n=1 Tax=Pleionea mediterranea TaxID=523701 RepID=A0A316FAN3_9GAMM|nr:2OG-Fe(II) oxygenase [Pleionea mediterranea]PWK43597.1 SM-20-related protein [Pleionea mediterranea]
MSATAKQLGQRLEQQTGEIKTPDLYEAIAEDLYRQGYSIRPAQLPHQLTFDLLTQLQSIPEHEFEQAGIGRETDLTINQFVRKDEIAWITGESMAGQQWLNWAAGLQQHLNRRLFLGLFSFESHMAHYRPGDFYKRHYDAFKGEANRVLSIVVYLNPDWQLDEGGEMVLYLNDDDQQGIKVTPGFATVVAFLSEEFPHEVLPAKRDRFSVAGWFRVNTSIGDRVDPPS